MEASFAVTSRAAARSALLSCMALACPAQAQTQQIDLPGGPLGAAAERLARQTGWSIGFEDRTLLKRLVPGVRGRMTAVTALQLLARQAGAKLERIGRTNWKILAADPPRPRKAVVQHQPPLVEDPAGQADDIIVRASKRNLANESYAGSVDLLAAPRVGIDAGTTAIVESTTILSSTYRGPGREKLFVRGISDSSFSGRLQSVTGLYLGEVRLNYNASDPDLQLYDIASVEVLHGPQGTLYGSGSMAGIIRVNPRMPERGAFRGSIGGGASAVAHGARGGDVDAVLNLPLMDNLALRMVGYSRVEGGFIDKPVIGRPDANRTTIDGGRALARWWPAAGWTLDAVGIAQSIRSRDSQYATIGAPRLTDFGAIAEPSRGDYVAGHLVVNGHLGPLTLVSASGVANQRFDERFGVSTIGGTSDLIRRHDLITHETRLARAFHDGTGWVAGIAYVQAGSIAKARQLGEFAVLQEFPTKLDTTIGVVQTVSEFAVFGEGTARLAPFLSVGGGARAVSTSSRTSSTISYAPDLALEGKRRRERWLLPTASLLLRPAERVTAYVRYQQGRRPSLLSPTPSQPDSAMEERINVVDAGARWTSPSGARASVSLEQSRWKNLQFDMLEGALGFATGQGGTWAITSLNASAAGNLGNGVSVDVSATVNRVRPVGVRNPTIGLTPDGVTVDRNQPVDVSLAGLEVKLPDVAQIIGRVGVQWTRAVGRGMLHIDGWARYEGQSAAAIGFLAQGRQGDYVRTALAAAFTQARRQWSLSIDNPLDAGGARYAIGSVFRTGEIVTPVRPRTIRIGYQLGF